MSSVQGIPVIALPALTNNLLLSDPFAARLVFLADLRLCLPQLLTLLPTRSRPPLRRTQLLPQPVPQSMKRTPRLPQLINPQGTWEDPPLRWPFLPMQFLSRQPSFSVTVPPRSNQLLKESYRTTTSAGDVIMLFRVMGVTNLNIFVNLDATDEGFRLACMQGFGVDPDKGFEHRMEQTKLVCAWSRARVQHDVKKQVEAVQKAHGNQSPCLGQIG